MQQQHQMAGNGGSVNPTHVTTEQIQQCLDENKQLILMIMEYQNVGKFAECTPYQAQLQKNLTYLAQIADTQQPGGGGGGGCQPTSSSMSPQPQPQTQTGHLLQHSQAPASQQRQQSPYAASKLPFQLNEQQQQQQPLFR